MYQFDRQLVNDLIQLEREFPCVTLGSKLSWPKPLPRRTAASGITKTASHPNARKKHSAPAE